MARGAGLSLPKSFAGAAGRTQDIQSRIDAACLQGGGVVELPAGKLPVLPLVLRSGVILRGAGRGATNLISIGAEKGSAATLAPGPIRYAGLQSLTISRWDGGCHTGLDFVSQPALSGKPHGGLWWSDFRDIEILGFDCGLRLEGGQGNYLLPHQFNSFERVYVRGTGVQASVQIHGQVNQIRFRDSMFELDRTRVTSGLPMIEIIVSAPDPAPAPKLILFDQCTFQESGTALNVSKVQGLTISSSWFENDGTAVSAADTIGLVIDSCRFANAGSNGPAVRLTGKSQASIKNSVFAGAKTFSGVKVDADSVVSDNNIAIWGAKL